MTQASPATAAEVPKLQAPGAQAPKKERLEKSMAWMASMGQCLAPVFDVAKALSMMHLMHSVHSVHLNVQNVQVMVEGATEWPIELELELWRKFAELHCFLHRMCLPCF
jgi:hypothetical protein